ncbi:arsenate reductase ArsC [Solimonas sp. K1W22B-7]|uniref:arsenate reductase ArsC n=1 Tax=Solimonas sp. K1W22B-7 TaxID=2303331 RepID=UPI000E3357D9|nr:arsenate reductase ArsC [Solimonas sp. K1W22B-7]AXQ28002.1 arsenate reductase ArsC [Solimonas sp. K1W22B-7]
MTTKIYKLLFLCTGNSARSILGEAIANDPAVTQGRLRGYSAGSFPKGQVNPWSLDLLERVGLPTQGLRSKSWDEFAGPDAPQVDFIFTVCDQAAGEQCPYWPGHPVSAHWGLPDPAAVEGSDEDKRRAFKDTYLALRRRIELFASLPLEKLDAMALRQQLDEIGRR